MDRREALAQLSKTMSTISQRMDVAPTEADGWLACQYITDFGRCLALGINTSEECGYPGPTWAGRGVSYRIKTLPMIIDLLNEISFGSVSRQRIYEVLDGMLSVWFVKLAAKFSYDSHLDYMKRHDWVLHLAQRDLDKATRELDQLLMERSQLFCREGCYTILREYRQEIAPELIKSFPWWLRGGLERQTPKIRQ
jgi:hypothetical protein